MAFSPKDNNFEFLKSLNYKEEFQHNDNLLLSGKGQKNIILKKIVFTKKTSETYSLLNFSSYDVIWIIEKDFLLLKKYLDLIFCDLPSNIPKLAIVTQNGEE